MLDTNICIYVARTRPAVVRARFEALEPGAAVISVVTWGELCYGAEKSAQRERVKEALEELTAFLDVAEPPADAGQHYGAIRAVLESQGTPIGNNDLWIAAHARSAGLTLVTNNVRELGRVPELQIENWAEPAPTRGRRGGRR
jgi:tRNA(fMet)-specific endonuclease VapC